MAAESTVQHGYLLIADISGYTQFMAGTELEHAHEIMSELLEHIVQHLTPTLTLCEVEGDALFTYAAQTKIQRGETLLELIESTYVAFRDRQEAMHRMVTCQCRACNSIPILDLKFLTHYGNYVVRNVAGSTKLVGSDVNMIHRLLKNHVSEATGWRGYALFSDAVLKQVEVQSDGMRLQTENYEHLGDVVTHSFDLNTRYKEITDARRVVVTPEEADGDFISDFPAPTPVVWDWVTDPRKRTLVSPETHWKTENRPGGRTKVGASNHCAHGKESSLETILDWRPFEYYTSEYTQSNSKMIITTTTRFEPIANGTRVHCWAKISIRVPKFVRRFIIKSFMAKPMKESWQKMAQLMVAERESGPIAQSTE
jgi:hypothetical protein